MSWSNCQNLFIIRTIAFGYLPIFNYPHTHIHFKSFKNCACIPFNKVSIGRSWKIATWFAHCILLYYSCFLSSLRVTRKMSLPFENKSDVMCMTMKIILSGQHHRKWIYLDFKAFLILACSFSILFNQIDWSAALLQDFLLMIF